MNLVERLSQGFYHNFKQTRYIGIISKVWYGANNVGNKPSESQIKIILRQRFPKAKHIKVEDVSGGCGAMFDVHISTSEFKNLSLVKQHMLINETLKEQIKDMHGIRISTSTGD